jgi:hypothetical protein
MAVVLPSDDNGYFAGSGLRRSHSQSNFISSTSPFSTSSHLSDHHYSPATKSYAESNSSSAPSSPRTVHADSVDLSYASTPATNLSLSFLQVAYSLISHSFLSNYIHYQLHNTLIQQQPPNHQHALLPGYPFLRGFCCSRRCPRDQRVPCAQPESMVEAVPETEEEHPCTLCSPVIRII